LATSGTGALDILAVKSVIVADILIIVVLGVGFVALSFPDGAILT
jgi:hypothetical protein